MPFVHTKDGRWVFAPASQRTRKHQRHTTKVYSLHERRERKNDPSRRAREKRAVLRLVDEDMPAA